ncbi:hypothetical protein ACCAA_10032 [Candidatus Accumulibacter aalborgensis]|uniref:Uncharacterized protein n=1 Tax=Candidatus Accumulibacter aalborgensis TaxID=1860102 RepID=A0A1A8XCY9_9PROT|nr:hypothetical protein ACCAA_10032 [Candidatus Accumulibacter aalborgensis]
MASPSSPTLISSNVCAATRRSTPSMPIRCMAATSMATPTTPSSTPPPESQEPKAPRTQGTPHAEFHLSESDPHPFRRGPHCRHRGRNSGRRARPDHLRWRECREDRDARRSQGRAEELHRLRVCRHRAQPDLRNADGGRCPRASREGRLPARRRRRLGDRRHQIHRRRDSFCRRPVGYARQARCGDPRDCFRQRPHAAGDRIGDEQRRRDHPPREQRQAGFPQRPALPPLLGPRPEQDLHPAAAPGRQRRRRRFRTHRRAIPHLPGRRQGAGPLCRRPAADPDRRRPARIARAGELRRPRQPDVDRHAGSERPDRCRRSAGLGDAHARSRTHRSARSRPCADARRGAARDAAGAACREARQVVAVRRTRLGFARRRRRSAHRSSHRAHPAVFRIAAGTDQALRLRDRCRGDRTAGGATEAAWHGGPGRASERRPRACAAGLRTRCLSGARPGELLMTDESWDFAERKVLGKPLRPAYYFGVALAMWATASLAGAIAGRSLGDRASMVSISPSRRCSSPSWPAHCRYCSDQIRCLSAA